jgi:hypothetical protein
MVVQCCYLLWACHVNCMKLMMWKFVMGWKNFHHGCTIFYSKYYYLDQKKEKIDRNVFISTFRNERFWWRLVCIKYIFFQRNLGFKRCHQYLLFVANHCLVKHNFKSSHIYCGIRNYWDFVSNGHSMCFELVLWVLVIV